MYVDGAGFGPAASASTITRLMVSTSNIPGGPSGAMLAFLSGLGTRELLLTGLLLVVEGVTVGIEGRFVAVTEFTGGCCTPGIGPAKAVIGKFQKGNITIWLIVNLINCCQSGNLLDLNSEFSK